MNLHFLFYMKNRSRSTRRQSRMVYAAMLCAALCLPVSGLLAQQTSSNQITGVSLTESDGTSLSTDSGQGTITVKLPHSDTTLTIDAKSRTFTVTSNKTGGSTPAIQTFPPTATGTSFSTGSDTVSVTLNGDLSVSVSVSNGNGTDAVTVKPDVNPQTGELTTKISSDADPNASASVTTDSKGAVANTSTVTTAPGGQSFEVTKGPDGLTHIYSKNQNGQIVSDQPVGPANAVVIGADGIPHLTGPASSATPAPAPEPAPAASITRALPAGGLGWPGGMGVPSLQVTGMGGAGILNHNEPPSAGFQATVLFPIVKGIQAGPEAGYVWQGGALVRSLGGGGTFSTFLDDTLGFQSKNIGGLVVLPLGQWGIGLHAGASFVDSALTETEGFCNPTAGCETLSNDTSHHSSITPFGGISVSHPLGSHLSLVAGFNYQQLNTGFSKMNDFQVYGGISFKLGLPSHNRTTRIAVKPSGSKSTTEPAGAVRAPHQCGGDAPQHGCPPFVADGPTLPGAGPGGAGPGGSGPGGSGPGSGPGGTSGGGTTVGAPPEMPPPPPNIALTVSPKCTYETTDGYFEPTQGVWQDDTAFVDKPGKQLMRNGTVDYTAELPMVVGRDTVLAGVDHYVLSTGGGRVVRDRDHISLSYKTNCTVPVPVKFKFTVVGSGQAPVVIYGQQIVMALIGDPIKEPMVPETATQWAYLGVPREETFKLENPGPYTITAELVRVGDDTSTGISMTLHGEVIRTYGPKVNFVPVQLREDGDPSLLQSAAKQIAEKVHTYVPDVFPLAPGDLPTQVLGLRNFQDAGVRDERENKRVIALIAQLEDALTASAFLDHAGRVVAILDQSDFDALEKGKGAAAVTHGADFHVKKAGVVLNWKLMIAPADLKVEDVAHELVHTLPNDWSSPGMLDECGRDYHNVGVHWANGLRLVGGGQPLRRDKDNSLAIMGPDSSTIEHLDSPLSSDQSALTQVLNLATGKTEDKLIRELWITQCTYWHLTKMLVKPPDPALILVRGFVSQRGGQTQGSFLSFYDVMGETDVEDSEAGDWAVILRDARGGVLGRYPFTPHWSDPDHTITRNLVAFDYRVPALPGVAEADLMGPAGLLDTKKFSSSAPVIDSLMPSADAQVETSNGRANVSWKASTQSGNPLLYTVLYSPDNDQSFGEQSFEQTGDSFDVKLAPGSKTHFVKVIASDGSQSTEKIVKFTIP